jgi:hypothetical protein
LLRAVFLSTLRRFDELLPQVEESIDFDVHKDLEAATTQIFGELPEGNELTLKADPQFYLNKEKLQIQVTAQQIAKPLIDDFLNENHIAFALLFFEPEIPKVLEMLLKWTSSAPGSGNTGEPAGKSKRLQFSGRTLFYEDFLDLRQQLDARLATLQLHKVKLQDITVSKTEVHKGDPKYDKTFKRGGRLPAKNEETGFLGEYLVYQYLLTNTKAKESVKWVSRYAKDCQLSTEDGTGAGYDLEYLPNGGTYPRYVEVKVVGHEDAFHISSNEVRFGEVNKKYHDVFLVRNAHDPAQLQIERISGLFDYGQGASFNQNKAFTVINDNYILKFKKSR